MPIVSTAGCGGDGRNPHLGCRPSGHEPAIHRLLNRREPGSQNAGRAFKHPHHPGHQESSSQAADRNDCIFVPSMDRRIAGKRREGSTDGHHHALHKAAILEPDPLERRFGHTARLRYRLRPNQATAAPAAAFRKRRWRYQEKYSPYRRCNSGRCQSRPSMVPRQASVPHRHSIAPS